MFNPWVRNVILIVNFTSSVLSVEEEDSFIIAVDHCDKVLKFAGM